MSVEISKIRRQVAILIFTVLPLSISGCSIVSPTKPKVVLKANTGIIKQIDYHYSLKYPELQKLGNKRVQEHIDAIIESTVLGDFDLDVSKARTSNEHGIWLNANYRVTLVTPRLFSVAYFYSRMDEDAAHPALFTSSMSFELHGGNQLTLADLFRPDTPILDILAHEVAIRLPRDPNTFSSFGIEKPSKEKLLSWTSHFNKFTLSPTTFNIHFDACTVTPCASGPYEVSIPYQVLRGLIREDGPLKEYR